MKEEIKFDIIKTQVEAKVRVLKATWTWEEPEKKIIPGTDKLHRRYVKLEFYNDNEIQEMYKWLDVACPEAWQSLGRTIWFDRDEDRTAFILRFS